MWVRKPGYKRKIEEGKEINSDSRKPHGKVLIKKSGFHPVIFSVLNKFISESSFFLFFFKKRDFWFHRGKIFKNV